MKLLEFLKKIDVCLVKCSRHILSLIMLSESIMLFSGAVARYVFNHSIMWIDELSSYLLVLLTLFGCYVSFYENKLASVTFMIDGLPARLNKTLKFLANCLSLILLVALAYYGFQLCMTPVIANTVTPVLRWSKLYFYAALPLLCCIMACHQILVLIDILFSEREILQQKGVE